MAETEGIVQKEQQQGETNKPADVSFSIWPPTQRTRDAVVNRLIETLSAPSVLSKRYGTMPQEEASATSRRIEEEAFTAAADSASSNDDGIEILQVYSKEISKRMLEAVKSRSASASAPDTASPPPAESPAPPTDAAPTEGVSSVETES